MRRWLPGIVLLSGCALTPSWHLGETAEVIHAREVAISTYGGGGADNSPNGNCCGAFGLKLRVGTGFHQEAGFNLNTGFSTDGGVALAAGFSYKIAPRDFIAVSFDAGGSDQWFKQTNGSYSTLPAFGSAFNLILSTRPLGGVVRIFGAARFSWAIPVAKDVFAAGEPAETLGLPFGFTVEPTRAIRLVFEGGVSGAFTQSRDAQNNINTGNGVFGWAAFTFTYIFRRR